MATMPRVEGSLTMPMPEESTDHVRAEATAAEARALSGDRLSSPLPGDRRLGDYRILGEVGRGGMGVVYEAEQISLGRRVALKVLPGHFAGDSRSLERFRREAKSAARLHHTNIVPVFEVGRDGDTAFYAMQFIDGQGLDRVINELARLRDRRAESPDRQGARRAPGADPEGAALAATKTMAPATTQRLEAVAESLLTGQLATEGRGLSSAAGYAVTEAFGSETEDLRERASGVTGDAGPVLSVRETPSATTHSAVLPGGTPISSIDTSGRRQPFYRSVAQIGRQTAQGLGYAHSRGIVHRDIKPSNLLLDTSGVVWITDFGLAKGEDDGLTQTGDLLGTLRYMAPERFRGDGDARADIYALGLTLYELLTLKPAFETNDRLKMIERVKNEEPIRPRLVDARIPRDLETIVLKAIEKDPSQRYATADAMAEDLRRFLADEPIRARRATLTERYVRWARRNPGIAVLGGILTAVLMLATAGSLLVAGRFAGMAERARNSALAEKAAREQASQRAEAEREARQEADVARKAESGAKQEAEKALRDAVDQTYLATQNEVRAMRLAHESGWRSQALQRLTHLTTLGSRNLDLVALRSDAIACLAEIDVRVGSNIAPWNFRAWRVVFSPDGKVLAVNDFYHSAVYLRDLENKAELSPAASAYSGAPFAFHPSGALALASGLGRVSYHAISPGERLLPTIEGEGYALGLAFSRSGDRVAVCWGEIYVEGGTPRELREITVHETDSGAVIRRITIPANTPISYKTPLAMSAGGDLVATTGPGFEVRVYSVDGDGEPIILGKLDSFVGAIAFHPERRSLAACGKQVAAIWNLDTRLEQARLHSVDRGFWDVAFSPDGRFLATASDDAMCRLFETQTGREVASAPTGTGVGLSIAFAPKGDRIAYGATSVSLLAIDGGRERRIETSQTNATHAAVFDPVEPWLYHVGADRSVYQWILGEHVARPVPYRTIELNPVTMLIGPGGGELVLGYARYVDTPPEQDFSLRVLRRDNLSVERLLRGPKSDIHAMVLSPSGRRIAATTLDGQFFVWNYEDGRLELQRGAESRTRSLAFVDDSRLLLAFEDRLRIVAVEGGAVLQELVMPAVIGAFVVSRGGSEAIVGTLDGGVHRVGLENLSLEQSEVSLDPSQNLLMAISSGGSLLAATARNHRRVTLLDARSLKPVAYLGGVEGVGVNFLVFDPKGRYLAFGNLHVRLWDLSLLYEELARLGLAWDQPEWESGIAAGLGGLAGSGAPGGRVEPDAELVLQESQAHLNRGVTAIREGRAADAIVSLERAREQSAALRRLRPEDDLPARLHGLSVGFLSSLLRDSERRAEALGLSREALAAFESIRAPTAGDLYNNACALAVLSSLDDKAEAATREAQVVRAVGLLRRAIAGDPARILSYFESDKDLDGLRERPDVRTLVADARFPRDVFASLPEPIPASTPELDRAISREPQNVALRLQRADYLAGRGRWEAALADQQEVLSQDANNSLAWMRGAVLYLRAGDVDGYRRHARAMFARFRDTEEASDAERTVKIGLLVPLPPEEAKHLVVLADRAIANGKDSVLFSWYLLARGMVAYRIDAFQEAANWLEQADASVTASSECRAAARAWLAMAQARLGDLTKARATLARAEELRAAGDVVQNWLDWSICDLARSEAAALTDTEEHAKANPGGE